MKKPSSLSPLKTSLLAFLVIILLGGGYWLFASSVSPAHPGNFSPIDTIFKKATPSPKFDGERAMQDVEYQVAIGDRTVGTEGHQKVLEWIVSELQAAGWDTEIQQGEMMGHPIQNVIARRKDLDSNQRWIILGAHYDTRMFADQDPVMANRKHYVPGANDGASGVAVLLEIARTLPADTPANVELLFIDTEDNGNIPGWDWLLGSKYYAQNLQGTPDAVVIIDMIGDADLNLYYEANSNAQLRSEIWAVANELGYTQFIPKVKHRMIDDHIPFVQKGITAVDIIDFDYPFWHTTQDSVDKVSGASMKAVGDTLLAWLAKPDLSKP